MTINNDSKKVDNSTTLFDQLEDYTVPTENRKYKYLLDDGTLIYLNYDQLKFMREDYWEEKREQYLKGRCLVGSERTGLKRCTEDCSKCQWYCHPKATNGVLNLDDLMNKYEFEIKDEQDSSLDRLIKEERLKAMYAAIDSLEDETDRKIIKLTMDNLTERQIGAEVGLLQKTLHYRRERIYKVLREKLKKFQD